MNDAGKLQYALRYLRRTKTLAQMQVLSELVGEALLAGRTKIAITSTGMEGGASSGQIEWDRVLTGQACEALLDQFAAAGITEPSAKLPADGSGRRLSHTVVFG